MQHAKYQRIPTFSIQKDLICYFRWGSTKGSNCNETDVRNRTSSVPSSVLCYVLDKGQYFNLKFCLYPILFPNKEADRRRSVKHDLTMKLSSRSTVYSPTEAVGQYGYLSFYYFGHSQSVMIKLRCRNYNVCVS